jgi:hypothetical protein
MKKWLSGVTICALFVLADKVYAGGGAIPEFDGGNAVTALSVLIGVIALAAERLRHRR